MPMLLRQRKKQSRSILNFGSSDICPSPALDTFGQQIKVMPGCQWITAGEPQRIHRNCEMPGARNLYVHAEVVVKQILKR